MMGVFTLILPLPIVVDSFEGCYKNRLWRTEVAHKKEIKRIRDEETDVGNDGELEAIKEVNDKIQYYLHQPLLLYSGLR